MPPRAHNRLLKVGAGKDCQGLWVQPPTPCLMVSSSGCPASWTHRPASSPLPQLWLLIQLWAHLPRLLPLAFQGLIWGKTGGLRNQIEAGLSLHGSLQSQNYSFQRGIFKV